jgi:hypothetical protein
MTDILTRISIPGTPQGWGFMDWGTCSTSEMITAYRARAAYLRKQAEAIEGTPDEGFCIDVVRGSQVCRHVRTLQEGSAPSPSAGS